MSNKTSDKNVANIKDLIQEYKTYNDLDGIQDLSIYINALENILAEREQMLKEKQDDKKDIKDFQNALNEENLRCANYAIENNELKKRIQELEKALLKVKDKNATLFITCRNSIAKEKVIDVIQEYKNKVEQYNKYREQGKETDVEYYENIANTIVVQVLQELLEGERK